MAAIRKQKPSSDWQDAGVQHFIKNVLGKKYEPSQNILRQIAAHEGLETRVTAPLIGFGVERDSYHGRKWLQGHSTIPNVAQAVELTAEVLREYKYPMLLLALGYGSVEEGFMRFAILGKNQREALLEDIYQLKDSVVVDHILGKRLISSLARLEEAYWIKIKERSSERLAKALQAVGSALGSKSFPLRTTDRQRLWNTPDHVAFVPEKVAVLLFGDNTRNEAMRLDLSRAIAKHPLPPHATAPPVENHIDLALKVIGSIKDKDPDPRHIAAERAAMVQAAMGSERWTQMTMYQKAAAVTIMYSLGPKGARGMAEEIAQAARAGDIG